LIEYVDCPMAQPGSDVRKPMLNVLFARSESGWTSMLRE